MVGAHAPQLGLAGRDLAIERIDKPQAGGERGRPGFRDRQRGEELAASHAEQVGDGDRVPKGDEDRVDAVLQGRPVAHQVQAEASPLPLRADRGVGQPDGGHEFPAGQLGEHPGVDPVGLRHQGRQTLGPQGIGDRDLPAAELELVVHEARAVHRLDGGLHRLAVSSDPIDQRPKAVGIGMYGGHLHRPTRLIEDVHVHPLARQVQSGVQHHLGLLVLVALTTQRCHQRGPSS